MPIKAVVFDLDGTLLDTITDITNCMNLALSKFSLPSFSEDDYKYLVGSGLDRLVAGVLPKHMKNEEAIKEFIQSFREVYYVRWRENSIPFKGIKDLLVFLQQEDIKIAIFSNKPHEITQKMAEELLPSFFSVIYGERVACGYPKKPDPTVAFSIMEQLGVLPEETLMIGDSDVDMQVAVNAGMIGVGVLWGFRTKEELLDNGAKHLVSTPLEIINLLGGSNG